jgi:hypothetical protein
VGTVMGTIGMLMTLHGTKHPCADGSGVNPAAARSFAASAAETPFHFASFGFLTIPAFIRAPQTPKLS